MIKRLATLGELQSQSFRSLMERVNSIARSDFLQKYTTYSRIWEYPWIWCHLEKLKGHGITVLDIGSEKSPFPWFLAMQGFQMILSDVSGRYWHFWHRAGWQLGVTVRKCILNAQDLALPPASVDVYLSISVVEHVPNKERVIAEAARVLRPGGLLVMSFDICEPDMGMTFPEWNGRALTMRELDDLFRNSPWFEPGLSELPWNTDDIPEYLSWHRTTAPHHNYVTGAAVVQRNERNWVEAAWKSYLRTLRGKSQTTISVAIWHLLRTLRAVQHKAVRVIKSAAQMALSWLVSPHVLLLFGESFFWFMGLRGKGSDIDLLQVKRVLVVRLDEIGDVVMTTSFLRELRRNLPNAWITLVVKPAVYNLVERCPYVNEVLTYDWSGYKPLKRLQRHLRALQLAWKHLWRRHFDLAILPRWDADHYHGTYLMYFSGASRRVGYSENVNALKKRLNGGFDRLLTHSLQDGTLKHEVEHNLDVIRGLGGKVEDDRVELWVGGEDETFVEEILRNHGVKSRELLAGLGPGAGALKRQWPIDLYVEFGLWLQNECRARVVIIGGPEEESIGSALKGRLGPLAINAVGNTTLRQAAAFLKQAALFVGSDAGPMHIAAAMGVPVVELSCHPKSGSSSSANSPERFRPWGSGHEVIQPGTSLPSCTDECIADSPHCILGITVKQVKQVVSQLLYGRSAIERHRIGCG